MSVLVITHEGERIVKWRYEANHEYKPSAGEFVAPDDVDHRNLPSKKLDTSTTPPAIIDNPDYEPPPTTESVDKRVKKIEEAGVVRQDKLNPDLKNRFRNARATGNVEKQLDLLFRLLTDENPRVDPEKGGKS